MRAQPLPHWPGLAAHLRQIVCRCAQHPEMGSVGPAPAIPGSASELKQQRYRREGCLLTHRVLARLAGVVAVIPLVLLTPVAAAADQALPLQPWQEESALAALQDRNVAVRYAAVTWLADRQTNSQLLARAVVDYFQQGLPPQIKKSAAQILEHMGPPAAALASRVVPLLADPVGDVRKAAASALLKMGPAAHAVAPQIATLLKAPAPEVRFYAAEVLGQMGAEGAVFAPQVAALLEDPVVVPAAGAAEALSNMGPAGAAYASRIAQLLWRASDPNALPNGWLRSQAAQFLSRMGPPAVAVLPQLVARFNSPDSRVRFAAVASLGDMIGLGPPVTALASQVAALLKDPDPDTRSTAARVLSRMGPAGAAFARQIAVLLQDPDNTVRSSAAEALGSMGPAAAAAAPELLAALKDPDDPYFRSRAAQALGRLGPAAAAVVPQLAALLKSSDADLRDNAVVAASGMGPAAAPVVLQLAALLKSRDGYLRATAIKALGQLGSAAAPVASQIVALLKDPDAPVSSAAQLALAHMGSAAAPVVPQLAAMLTDSHSRYSALQALEGMGLTAAPAAPQMVAMLKASPFDTILVGALQKMGPEAAVAVPQLAALLTDSDPAVRSHAAEVLGNVGPAAATLTSQLADLLKDPAPAVRAAAAEDVGRIGSSAAPWAIRIVPLLGDPDSKVRDAAIQALDSLTRFGPLQDLGVVLSSLNASHVSRSDAATFLLRAYLYRRLDGRDLILIRWLGNREPAERPVPTQLDSGSALAALQTFNDTWDATKSFPELRREMAESIASLAPTQAGKPEAHLAELEKRLAPQFPIQALAVQAVLDQKAWYEQLDRARWLIATHFCAWVLLIFAYPRWRWVQSFFFWNKWARRFLGFFYVGVLIRAVPWLRRRMLAPFKESFLPQRILEQLNERAYFADGEVLLEKNRRTEPKPLPVKEILAVIRGQIVLKGQSGLGKTLLVLRLALATKEPVVFLRATECSGGVLAAIQKRVQGQLRDEGYLRTLIYAGGLKVLIDGLNEASPDARTRITRFVEEYFKGDFILTTQPISWEPPATARVYVLQPLSVEQIKPFLLKQWASVAERATLTREQYEHAVVRYLEGAVRDSQASGSAQDASLVALSNPMDATLAAELLARGETPDTFRLVEQRYRVVAEEFREREGRDFRLQPLSERVYEWRRSGEPDIHTEGFEPEVAALVKDRLMIRRTGLIRQEKGEKEINRWFFRHDRIMEFFLLPAFMEADSARRQEHVMDERFSGVYELLAIRLPDEEERKLHRLLIERAADTNRNDLLNRYTLARRSRALAQQAGRPAAPSIA